MENINISNPREALQKLNKYKNKEYDDKDIKLSNVWLRQLNDVCKKKIFYKNDLYVSSKSLYEVMRPIGGEGKHHYHGMKPEDLFFALTTLSIPYCVAYNKTKDRYLVFSPINECTADKTIISVIEIKAPLKINKKAEINKLVTIYWKDKGEVDKMNTKEDIIVFYKKSPSEGHSS